jgi:uncharacterized damage-inducible protein DinB
MTHADLVLLIDFHYWARNRVLEAVSALSPDQYIQPIVSSFPSVRDTLVHLYSSETVWYGRWTGHSPTSMLDPSDYPDLAGLRAAWDGHEGRMRQFVANLGAEGVERTVDYRSLQGQPQASAMWEMVQHVVNHGTYHRGQIQTMLRQLGAAPSKSLDLIAYHRERQAPTSGR